MADDEELNYYDLGDLVRVCGTFTDPENDEAPVDPTEVYLKIQSPDEDAEIESRQYDEPGSTIVRVSEGVYKDTISATLSGTWSYRWIGTGVGQAAEEKQFIVEEARAV